jgi:hypothetical protein
MNHEIHEILENRGRFFNRVERVDGKWGEEDEIREI